MYSNEIECVIAEYLKNPKAEYAVMETASNILTDSLGAVNIDLSKIKETCLRYTSTNQKVYK